MKSLLKLTGMIKKYIPVLLLAILFGTLGNLCAIGIPVLGTVALNHRFPFYLLIIIGLLRGIFHYIEQYCNHFLAFSVLAKIREAVFQKLRELGPAKLESKEKGSIIALLTSDIELLEVFFAHTLSPVCIAILTSCTMLVFFSKIHWITVLIACFFYILVGIILPLCVNKSAYKIGMEHRSVFAKTNTLLLDNLRGIQQSILYSNGEEKLAEIQKSSKELSVSRKKMSKHEGLTMAMIGFIVSSAAITMMICCMILYSKGEITYFQGVLSTVAMFSSFGPVIAVSILGSSLSQTMASAKRVCDLMEEKPIVNQIKNENNVDFDGAKADSVSFKYPKSDDFILKDVSIDFDKGKIIGIKGKSGCGKSTLIKLFMHIWEQEKGSVKISDSEVSQINSDNLRKMESYVTQETVLFHDSILNNIKIAKLDATQSEVEEACKKAAIHDFIISLPKGYETEVAELGDNFSGGERQRLGLARAFLHNGDFILLDEPTSNLDSYNEKKIMEAVKKESEGKTVVVVSHRDSTFDVADCVFEMNSFRKS